MITGDTGGDFFCCAPRVGATAGGDIICGTLRVGATADTFLVVKVFPKAAFTSTGRKFTEVAILGGDTTNLDIFGVGHDVPPFLNALQPPINVVLGGRKV